MPNNCGNCNFHGQIKLKDIWCYFWQKWVSINYSCEHLIDSVPGMKEELRIESAAQKRKTIEDRAQDEDAERRHKEQLEAAQKFHKKDIKTRWLIVIASLIGGFLLGLLTRLIF